MQETFSYDGLYIVCSVTTDPGCGPSYYSAGEPATSEMEIVSVEVDDPEEWAECAEEYGHDMADPWGDAERFRDCWAE